MRIRHVAVPAGIALAMITAVTAPAGAASSPDADRDGMPTSWERTHHLNPHNSADAKADPDRDGLTNLTEYRLKGLPRDEDTDNDGQDDGDERTTRTRVDKADTDGDRVLDGDEDADRDGVANEDEDDATEICASDDDDSDNDNVNDEDENDLRSNSRSADSDRDGVRDGDEDADRDGQANEDEDDTAADRCSGDRDEDGRDDEDEGDVVGTIESYDSATGVLTVLARGGQQLTLTVTDSTEITVQRDRKEQDEDGNIDDLTAGTRIAEAEVEDGELEEIELVSAPAPAT